MFGDLAYTEKGSIKISRSLDGIGSYKRRAKLESTTIASHKVEQLTRESH